MILKLLNSVAFAKLSFCKCLCMFICLLCAFSVMGQTPIVSGFSLENGVRVLYAPRPGCGAIHAAWFIEGGRSGAGKHQPIYVDALLAAWFADFDMLGASGFWIKATAGGISHGRDIAPETLEDWCRSELNRLQQVLRQEQINAARRSLQSQRRDLDIMTELCKLISSRNTFESSEQNNAMGLDSVSVNDLQGIADKYVAPDRLLIVMIGDVKESRLKDVLNDHFGTLNTTDNLSTKVVSAAQNHDFKQLSIEERKKEISSEEKTEVLVAWPIPQGSHGNWPYLELFAEILTGGTHSVLIRHLETERNCAYNVQALVGVQDGCSENLFIIRANVVDGHTPQEVESAIQNEVQNLLHNGLRDIEINHAINRLDTKRALRLADAFGLAQELLYAYESFGDWSPALAQFSDGVNLEQRTSTLVLRSILQPDTSFSLLAERDPIRSPKNLEQARLVSLLLRLLENKVNGPTQRETLIKNTIRQYELMPVEMRGQLFSLIESEAAR